MIFRDYRGLAEQTIFDVALMHYGSVEGVAWLLEDNPQIIQSDGTLPRPFVYKIRKGEKINEQVSSVMALVIPVTHSSPSGSDVWIGPNGEQWVDPTGGGWGQSHGQSWVTPDGQSWVAPDGQGLFQ